MDARELTKTYNNLRDRQIEDRKQIDYLTQEMEKLRLMVSDMKIDLEMMQRMRR